VLRDGAARARVVGGGELELELGVGEPLPRQF
jgi:hypothetical protein